MFERDTAAIKPLGLSDVELRTIESTIESVEKGYDDDAESIITSERYEWIARVIKTCVTKAPAKLSTTAKIDRVVTSRALGLPIFAAIMKRMRSHETLSMPLSNAVLAGALESCDDISPSMFPRQTVSPPFSLPPAYNGCGAYCQ